MSNEVLNSGLEWVNPGKFLNNGMNDLLGDPSKSRTWKRVTATCCSSVRSSKSILRNDETQFNSASNCSTVAFLPSPETTDDASKTKSDSKAEWQVTRCRGSRSFPKHPDWSIKRTDSLPFSNGVSSDCAKDPVSWVSSVDVSRWQRRVNHG